MKLTKRWFSYVAVLVVFMLCAGVFAACGANPTELASNNVQLEYTSVVYNGEERCPSVTIVINEEEIDASEYKVEYSNNTSVGSATVKITANEKSKLIKGSVSVGFEIVQAEAVATTLQDINNAIANKNYCGAKINQAFILNANEKLTIPEGFTVNFGDNILINMGKISNNGVIIENKNIVGSGAIENNGEIRAEVSTFLDLANAPSYATNVKIMADIEAGSNVEENKFNICENAKYNKLTIDLNGHTVKRQFRLDSDFGSRTVEIVNTSRTEAVINTHGLLKLPAIFIKGNADNASQEFIVKLSNIKAIGDDIGSAGETWAAISSNGTYKGEYYKISAVNCIFEAGDTAGAYLPAGYNYKFENCTFTGSTGYYTKSGIHKLINCTISGTKNEYSQPSHDGNGANETGSALVLDSATNYNEPLIVGVNGGKFSSVSGYAIEEFATSGTGVPNFYSTLEIIAEPKYSYGVGKTAVAVPTFECLDEILNAQEAVDEIFEQIAENKQQLGSSTTYTVEQITEIISEFNYYIELGVVKNIQEIEKFTIGNTDILQNQLVKVSIGDNNFIEDKAFYIQNNKLYVSAIVLAFEAQNTNIIKLNGKAFEINVNSLQRRLAVSNLNYLGEGNSATAVEGLVNEYNLTIANATDFLEIYYASAQIQDKVLTRKEQNGVVSYGMTEVEKTEGNPLGLYVVGYFKNFNNVPREKDGTTLNYSFYVVGKGIATLKFHIDLVDVA